MSPTTRLAALLFLPLLITGTGQLGCQSGDDTSASPSSVSCPSGSEKSLVMTHLTFVRQMPRGVSDGFQLIDHVAEKGDPATCGHASLTDPKGRRGVNNQLSDLMATLDVVTKGAAEPEVLDAINSGMLLFGIRMPNFPSQRDASCVDLEFRMLAGKPSVGTDMRLDPNQTFGTNLAAPVSTARGTMKEGVIEAGPFELVMPLRVQDAQFTQVVHGAHIRITLDEGGSASALLGGAIDDADFVNQFSMLPLPGVKEVLTDLVAIISDLSPDPMTGSCGQFSAALMFDAKNAFINP